MTKQDTINAIFSSRAAVLEAEAKQNSANKDAQFHQALSLLQKAFDALESTTDSDIEDFEDEEEEAEIAPTQYASRLIMVAMALLRQ